MSNVNSGNEFLGYIINRQVTCEFIVHSCRTKCNFYVLLTDNNCYFQFLAPCSIHRTGGSFAPFKLKQIMYIRPNLKVFEALFKMKTSPLLGHILHPKYNCAKPQKRMFKYRGYVSIAKIVD